MFHYMKVEALHCVTSLLVKELFFWKLSFLRKKIYICSKPNINWLENPIIYLFVLIFPIKIVYNSNFLKL